MFAYQISGILRSAVRSLVVVTIIEAAALVATAGPAQAKGTVVVTQSKGSSRVYTNVFIRVRNGAMSLTSSDGKGMLMIGNAACIHINKLLRCIAYDATLDQLGEALHLSLKNGTAWLNLTTTSQPIAPGSARIRPRSVMLSFETKAGTTVSATGKIDQVQQ